MSRLHFARAEIRLAHPDVEPLRPPAMVPHPLEAFQQALAKVDVAGGERADVMVDLLPLTPPERMTYRKRLRAAEIAEYAEAAGGGNKRGWGGAGNVKDVLTRDLLAQASPIERAPDLPRNEAARQFGEMDASHLAHRVAVPSSLFHVQILIRTASFDRDRANAHLETILALWDMWAGRNYFEMVITNLRFAYFGSNVNPRRTWFDYRFRTGRFGPLKKRGSSVVSIDDIAGLITPPPTPPEAAAAPAPPRSPTPPARPVPAPTRQLPPVRNEPETDVTVVLGSDSLLDEQGEELLYGIGRRGSAVDQLAVELVAKATQAGAGAVVLESDSSDQRVGIPAWGTVSRTVMPLLTTDVTRPVAGWNPLLPSRAGSPVDRAAVAVRALTAMAGSSDASQAAALVQTAVSTLQTLVAFLPPQLAPTLFQISRLIDDPLWREALLPVLDGPMRRFWTDVLPGLHRSVARSVSDLVRSLRDDPAAAGLLGQPATTYDPYVTLAACKTVVLSGDATPLNDSLAMLLWLDATAAARALVESGRDGAPLLVATAADRRDRDDAGMFIDDLAATVQSGVHVVLLTDRPDRHRDKARRALRGLATAVAVDSVDAGADIAATWVGLDGAQALQRTLDSLGLGECLVVTAREGWRPQPLSLRRPITTDMASAPPAADAPEGEALQSTRARLDDLEERIVDHLLSPPPPDPEITNPDEPDTDTNVISFDPSRRRRGPSQK